MNSQYLILGPDASFFEPSKIKQGADTKPCPSLLTTVSSACYFKALNLKDKRCTGCNSAALWQLAHFFPEREEYSFCILIYLHELFTISQIVAYASDDMTG